MKYRKISTAIWNDQRFRQLGHMAKLVMLFLLTHPHMTQLGAIRIGRAAIAEELGISQARAGRLIRELVESGMLFHEPDLPLFFFPNFLRHNPPASTNVIRGWGPGFDELPECGLKTRIADSAKEFCQSRGEAWLKAFSETFSQYYQQLMQETR